MGITREKIYISGSNGFIGSHLSKNLHSKSLKIKKITRNNFKNLTSKNTSNSVLIYLSQPSNLEYVYRDRDLKHLKNILKKKWFYIIYFSSCLVRNKAIIFNKKIVPDYIKLKIESEKIIKKNNSTILRISNVYSNKFKKDTFLYKLRSIKKKNEILDLAKENHKRDFIHVEDISKCIIKILKYKPKGTFNLGSGRSITTNELIKLMSKRNIYIRRYLSNIKFKKNIDTKVNLDITKTMRELHWRPTIFIKGQL